MKGLFFALVIILLTSCDKSNDKNKINETKLDYHERCRLLVLEKNIPN